MSDRYANDLERRPEWIARVTDAFSRDLGSEAAGVWSAPGRVNLIGEHIDYHGATVLPFATRQRTYVAAAARTDGVVRVRSAQQAEQVTFPARVDSDGVTGWAGYVAGVVWALNQAGQPIQGGDLLVDGDVQLRVRTAEHAAVGLGRPLRPRVERDRKSVTHRPRAG